MIRHVWSLVCKESKVDSSNNNITIVDVYESLQIGLNVDEKNYKKDSTINVPFNFELVSLFYRDKKVTEEEIEEVVSVLDPKGQKLGEFHATITFKPNFDRMRNIFKFNSLALTSSGTYVFQAHTQKVGSTKREPVTVIPLDIQVIINDQKS